MDVQKHFQLVFLLFILRVKVLQHKTSYQLYLSKSYIDVVVIVCQEVSVHVFALSVTTIISTHNSVGIHDWNNPELKLFSKLKRQHISRHQKIDKAVDYKA